MPSRTGSTTGAITATRSRMVGPILTMALDKAAQSTDFPCEIGIAMPTRSSGFWALSSIAAFHQHPVDPDQMLRALGLEHRPIGVTEILLACAELKLRAKQVVFNWEDFTNSKLPTIILLKDGDFA